MQENKFDILSFVETKITDDIKHLFDIEGYQMYCNCNKRNSGGISLYISETFVNHFERIELRRKNNHIECMFIEIPILNQPKNIIVGSIYHRPNSSGVEFVKAMSDILTIIGRENKKIYTY